MSGFWPVWRRRLLHPLTLAAVAMLLVYALAGFVLAPWLLNRYLPGYVEQRLGHHLALGRVRINPFLFTLEVRDFRLRDAEDELLFSYARFLADFELESIFRWAWTFADIELTSPSLHLILDRTGHLNLNRLLERFSAREQDQSRQEGEESQVRLLFKHFSLTGGGVEMSDRSGTRPITSVLSPVTMEFNGISTLPERNGSCSISANLPEGGRLFWMGKVSLTPLASHGTLIVNDFRPAVLFDFFQDHFKLARPEGHAHLKLDYRLAQDDGKTEFVAQPLMYRLDDLVLREKEGDRPLLMLAALQITDARFDLAGRELHLPAVSLRRGAFNAEKGPDGLLDWNRLYLPDRQKGGISSGKTGKSIEKGEGESTPLKAEPWRLKVDSLRMEELTLGYGDQSRRIPYSLTVDDIALNLAAAAEVGVGPPAVRISDLAMRLRGISNREAVGDEPLWSLTEAQLAGGSFDLADRQVRLPSLVLTGGRAEVLRTAANSIRQLEALAPALREEGAQPTASPADPVSPAWRFLLEHFTLADFDLDYLDQGFGPDLRYDLRDLTLAVEGVDTASSDPIPFAARTQIAQGGFVEAEGSLSRTGEEIGSRLKVEGLNLQPLAPLLGRYLELRLASGALSLESQISFRKKKQPDDAKPLLKIAGRASIKDFLLEESGGQGRLLAWQELLADGIDFSLVPASLTINEIQARKPEAKITILEDKSVNLSRLVKKNAQTDFSQEPTGKPAEEPEQETFPLQVERVRVENGIVEFADLSLVLPFVARIERFKGTVLNISGDRNAKATLNFSGQVAPYGQAQVDGSLSPLDPKHFLDVKVNFRNVELLPISPYTATFAGRRVATGRLDLDLGYRIDDSELQGDHRVVLRDFRLGERVESPNALDLPLDLAIALLTDREGKIEVAVPVHGNLDKPEFSYGHVIWQAVRNLLTRIVTAPFQALGSLFGAGTTQPDRVFFEPGQVEPAPPEQEKLQQVAAVLNQRPQLILTVHGAFARDVDGRSLRDMAVRRSLAELLEVDLPPGEDPGPVAFAQARTQRALEELAGDRTLAEFQKEYEADAGVEARRVNPLLALMGKGSDDLEFYRALFAHLVADAPLAEEELQQLAVSRREAVLRELGERAGLAPERLIPGSVQEAEDGKSPVALLLELGVGTGDAKR